MESVYPRKLAHGSFGKHKELFKGPRKWTNVIGMPAIQDHWRFQLLACFWIPFASTYDGANGIKGPVDVGLSITARHIVRRRHVYANCPKSKLSSGFVSKAEKRCLHGFTK